MKNIEIKKTVMKLQGYEVTSKHTQSEPRFATRFSGLPRFNPANLINLMIIFVLTIFCGLGGFAQGFSGGNGTQNNPFLISNPNDLVGLSNYVNLSNVNYNTTGQYFLMTQDIDMSGVSDFKSIGYGFDPSNTMLLHAFCGNFDGGGFAIKNLTMNWGHSNRFYVPYKALFGRVHDASISNLTLDNAVFISTDSNGGYLSLFVAYSWGYTSGLRMENCIAKNCTLTQQPTNTNPTSAVGLVAAIDGNGKSTHINNCHIINTQIDGGFVVGFCQRTFVGGVCSQDEGITVCTYDSLVITNSSVSNSSISGGYSGVGFIVGIARSTLISDCHVSNCVISGESMAVGFASGVPGAAIMHGTRISNCYAQTELHLTKVWIPYSQNPFYDHYGAYGFSQIKQGEGLDVPNLFNCYAACEIHSFDNNSSLHSSFGGGLIYDIVMTNLAVNCYYLNQPPINVYRWQSPLNNIIGKTQSDLQSANMVSYPGTANNSLNYLQPNKPWKPDCRYYPINKGYPILSWQYLQSVVITLAATDTMVTSVTLNGIVIENSDSVVEKGFQWRQAGVNDWNTV